MLCIERSVFQQIMVSTGIRKMENQVGLSVLHSACLAFFLSCILCVLFLCVLHFVCLSFCLSCICLSCILSVCIVVQYACLYRCAVCLSVLLLSVCQSVCLSWTLSVFPKSVCLSVFCLSDSVYLQCSPTITNKPGGFCFLSNKESNYSIILQYYITVLYYSIILQYYIFC